LCGPEPEADFSSDVFSLGVTLFEMLAGQLPYPPGSLNQIFRRHGCDPPADLRRFVPAASDGLVGLLDRLLARRPERRPSAGTVVQQLIALEIGALRRRAG